ncbi:hypothetical protein [Spirosoma sp. KNUC1025]|uniref:hypothetical protein n=1 Tax=Spirosoma sp. KNUC1025 TaxID=2894082 RepID=UPI00386EED9C|nr:hypothetical protein LN737_19300 [Spirosoma sp. KNUC1025]
MELSIHRHSTHLSFNCANIEPKSKEELLDVIDAVLEHIDTDHAKPLPPRPQPDTNRPV